MSYMFYGTSDLVSLNTNSWNISSVGSSNSIFGNINPGLALICNDQDNTNNGTGVNSTGTMFGRTCN